MVYFFGAAIGPLLASTLMSIYGPYSFFLFESAVAVVYAIFVLFRALIMASAIYPPTIISRL